MSFCTWSLNNASYIPKVFNETQCNHAIPPLQFRFSCSLKESSIQSLKISSSSSSSRLNCVNDSDLTAKARVEQVQSDKFVDEARGLEPRIDGTGGIDDSFGGGGDDGDGDGDGDSGGDGDGDGDSGEDEAGLGPIVKLEEVMKELEARGVRLPEDMMDAAKTTGIRKLFLNRYIELQGSFWPLAFLMNNCSMLRDRMLADPSFLFKVGTEVVIDSCCATFAEVQKRGKDFWSEFELYLADLLVGIVVDVAIVSMMAPYARFGCTSATPGLFGPMRHACAALPSSVFEAERPGCRFSLKQRVAAYFYKGVLYGSVGFGCGLIGQGIANMVMTAKRSVQKSEHDIPVPPLVQSAALWGAFLAVSSNTRYQILTGLEYLVERSPLAKRTPPVAMAFTVGIRFANNIYGGMQFVDWAKQSGVQ